jgi:hypothetical protein
MPYRQLADGLFDSSVNLGLLCSLLVQVPKTTPHRTIGLPGT